MIENTLSLIKEAMRTQGIRQTDLAQRIGTTQAMLSQVLNGIRKPGPELLVRINTALSINPDIHSPDLQIALPPRICPFMSLAVIRAAISSKTFVKRLIESVIVAFIVRSIP